MKYRFLTIRNPEAIFINNNGLPKNIGKYL